VKHQKIFKQVYKLMMECILPPYLAVPCDILENILQVPLSGPSIKVLGMTKEEQHKRKVEQLMKFLQLPLVALLSKAVRNDLRHQTNHRHHWEMSLDQTMVNHTCTLHETQEDFRACIQTDNGHSSL
jgi:hypothetical protein